MSYFQRTQEHWLKLSDQLLSEAKSDEQISLAFFGEESLFLRFNNGKVRQSTSVDQLSVEITWQKQKKRMQFQFQMSGDLTKDLKTGSFLINRARSEWDSLPEDPFVTEMKNNGNSEAWLTADLPSERQCIESIISATAPEDFAGFYSGGPIYRASRNSLGQSHWFCNQTFFYDYSLFTLTEGSLENKAVKGTYSEKNWNDLQLKEQIASQKQQLRLLKKDSLTLKPGNYRVYLAPAAVAEIAGMFSWRGVSYASYRQGQSALAKLADNKEFFSSQFNLSENFNLGLAPRFNSNGEVAPPVIPLIQEGRHKNWLISSKTAQEYAVTANAAETTGWFYEAIRCAEISPGTLPQKQALEKLGTGVYLGNLHYINWSDVPNARITGMTRYACFWVENGEIIAPIKDMRFDESLFRIFGSELIDLTLEQGLEPNVDTYLRRELGGKKVPGALIKDFRFTL